jgi:cell division protein FtsQ
VKRVEVRGTRYLAPHHALEASGITAESNVFDDPAVWRDSLMRHPLVADARISRRPPGTIVIRITEAEPIALVRTPVLRPVDPRGRVLPVTAGLGDLDIPILGGRTKLVGNDVTDEKILTVLEGLATIRARQPDLWPWISEVYPGRSRDARLVLRWPEGAEILIALPIEPARLDEVRLVIADLATGRNDAAQAEANPNELTRLARIDARFNGQVVVALDGAPYARRGAPQSR